MMWDCVCSRHEGPSRTLPPMPAGRAWASLWSKSGSFLGVGNASADTSIGPLRRRQRSCALKQALEAEAATTSGHAALRMKAKVAVHPFEHDGIDVGLGSLFRRVRFAAGPDSGPRLQHRSGSLDAGVGLRHQHLRQALTAPRYILQLAEQPRD